MTHTFSQQIPITPSDTADQTPGSNFDGFILGGGDGTLSLITPGGQIVAYTGLIVGQPYPFEFKRIRATGTGATGIVGLKL